MSTSIRGNFSIKLANITHSMTDLSVNYQYLGFGSAAVFTNFFIFFILFRNWDQLKKSAFIFGLAFGDLMMGLALLITGIARLDQVYTNIDGQQVHPWYCMIRYTSIFLLGSQVPGAMFMMIGAERFLAVTAYKWYYKHWTNKLAWKCTACAFIYCVISTEVAAGTAYFQNERERVPITCTTPTVVGPKYSIYNYSVAIVGGTVASMLTITALVVLRKQISSISSESNTTPSQWKSQRRMTVLMTCLAFLDLGLVVVPNILCVLSIGFNIGNLGSAGSNALQVICSRCVLGVFIYLGASVDFRRAALKAFGVKYYMTPVKPITTGQMRGVNSSRL